jgi:Cu/Zn superoxide dismutase
MQVHIGFVFISSFIAMLLTRKPKLVLPQYRKAICILDGYGTVIFKQISENMLSVHCDLKNVSPGKHGLHVHRCGDLTDCNSMCDHYNPDGAVHGGPSGKCRHRGDLGNILAQADGRCIQTILAELNIYEILGRGLVLHEKEDDLGQGGDDESLKTGNAGKRIGCGVIAHMRD